MIILYLCEKTKTLFAYGAKYALLTPNDPHASISVHVVCNVHLKSPRKRLKESSFSAHQPKSGKKREHD